jgi:hypothetical protein
VSTLLEHYRKLPRPALQTELRGITGIKEFYLWEYIGLGWMHVPVHAGQSIADRLGVKQGDVIGYRVLAGHVFGGALGDLMNVDPEALHPPHPDPFR